MTTPNELGRCSCCGWPNEAALPNEFDLDRMPIRLARPWPDGVPEGATRPNDLDRCSSCFWPMMGDKLWWNGTFMHARCAAEHERLVLGDDAMPGLLEHLDALEERSVFLVRLGREAVKLGIDIQLLAQAIERASSNAE